MARLGFRFYGFVIILTVTLSALAEPNALLFYSTDSPPIWTPSLPKNGLAGEILDAVAQESGLSVRFDYLPLKRYERLTQGNRVGNPLYFSGQEFAAVIPLLATRAGFCYYQPRHPDGWRFRSLLDLYGMTLGVIRGTIANKEEFSVYGVKIEENSTLDALFKKLQAGRVDAVLVIDMTAYYYIERLFPDRVNEFKFNALAGGDTPIAIMLDSRTADAGQVTKKIRQALDKIIGDGRYERILAAYRYGSSESHLDWKKRLSFALERYRASPIVIHE